jgi:hypothetical protein
LSQPSLADDLAKPLEGAVKQTEIYQRTPTLLNGGAIQTATPFNAIQHKIMSEPNLDQSPNTLNGGAIQSFQKELENLKSRSPESSPQAKHLYQLKSNFDDDLQLTPRRAITDLSSPDLIPSLAGTKQILNSLSVHPKKEDVTHCR